MMHHLPSWQKVVGFEDSTLHIEPRNEFTNRSNFKKPISTSLFCRFWHISRSKIICKRNQSMVKLGTWMYKIITNTSNLKFMPHFIFQIRDLFLSQGGIRFPNKITQKKWLKYLVTFLHKPGNRTGFILPEGKYWAFSRNRSYTNRPGHKKVYQISTPVDWRVHTLHCQKS